MPRIAVALAIAAILASAAIIAATSPALPPMVASHFVAGGVAAGFQPRVDYALVMLALAITPPVALLLAMGALPRVAPQFLNLPNLRAWLDSPRREEALDVLAVRGAVGAIIVTLSIAAAHLVLLQANLRQPPRLDVVLLGAVVGVFIGAMLVWTAALLHRLRWRG